MVKIQIKVEMLYVHTCVDREESCGGLVGIRLEDVGAAEAAAGW